MLPAIERRSGRSRYTSATRSSSSTATRCSPTSTETSSSRFACGRGARRGGSRRRRCCGRSRSRRCAGGFRSLVAVFVLGGAASVLAVAVDAAVVVFFERPRPPRLPRRRLGLVLLGCPASPAGSVLTGSGAFAGAAASLGAISSDFLGRNERKKNLLRARALRQRRLGRRRGACAAGCGRWKTSAHRVPTGPAGPAVRSRT